MAEGFAKKLRGAEFEVYSAGIEAHGLNPHALKVMAEIGIDISNQKSQNINEFMNMDIDTVITVCGHAHETCPLFPSGAKIIHAPFPDPPVLAARLKEKGEKNKGLLEPYKEVRDKIQQFIVKMEI